MNVVTLKKRHQGNNIRCWNHRGESTIILGQNGVMRHWGNCSRNIVRSQNGLIFEGGKNVGFARWLDLVCESKRGIKDDLKCWFVQLNSFPVWLFQPMLLMAICSSVQFSSVAQSCPTLCDPMNRSTPGLPVHHQLPEFTQTHVHRLIDAIQPSHPLPSPSPPAPNPSRHQSLFQWVNSSHEVAKVLEFQL